MASGAEHFKMAERYRERAGEAQTFAYDATEPADIKRGRWQADYFNAAAQVHATLALVQATLQASQPEVVIVDAHDSPYHFEGDS